MVRESRAVAGGAVVGEVHSEGAARGHSWLRTTSDSPPWWWSHRLILEIKCCSNTHTHTHVHVKLMESERNL